MREAHAFRRGLSGAGYVEHRNVGIDYSWAEGRPHRLPALATELVSREVTVIAATGGPQSARAAKAASATIPIVFVVGSDPVREGLVSRVCSAGAICLSRHRASWVPPPERCRREAPISAWLRS
jgi:putative tryptophan/tyrosine transport system substrate-binding protein